MREPKIELSKDFICGSAPVNPNYNFAYTAKATMRILLSLILIAVALTLPAQSEYKIESADKVKTGHKVFPANFFTAELPWGAVKSMCLDGPVKYGKWLKLNPKTDQVTFTVFTGKPNGNIEAPIVYIGEVVTGPKGSTLKELKCKAFAQNEPEEYSLSVKGLKDDGVYFVLVASEEPRASFAIEITGEYFSDPEPLSIKEEVAEITAHSISGKVTRKSTGKGISDHKVELLDLNMNIIKSVQTDSEGAFKFEKLPPEEVYLTRIEEEDPDLHVHAFRFDHEGLAIQKASRVGERIFGFPTLEGAFKELLLLSDDDWQLNSKSGKVGIVGRLVDGRNMMDGFRDVSVGLYDMSKKQLGTAKTDINGRFVFLDKEQKNYLIRYENKPEMSYSEVVMVDDLNVPYLYANSKMEDEEGFFRFEELPRELVEMKRMEVADTKLIIDTDFSKMDDGKPIVLKNILFSSGSFELLASSYAELDRLATELKEQESVRIEISGHTDNTGNANTNLLLSENRAKAVRTYLVSKGIAADRLDAKGYGSKKTMSTNDTEDGRKANRRVEFVVIQ